VSPRSFSLEQSIRVPVHTLHDFLCDLHNYVALHPLIESIEDLPPTESLPSARRYRVLDRIPLGPVRIRTTYTAALESVSPNEVHGHAWQFPSVRLHTVYTLDASADGTRLLEQVAIEAPWILQSFVTRQAEAAHAETLRKMKVLLEEGPGSTLSSEYLPSP